MSETASHYLSALCSSNRSASIPSTMLVVAHPDDETIAIGGQCSRFDALTIVYLTDGVPRNLQFARNAGHCSNESYQYARKEELSAALCHAMPKKLDVIWAGLTDQETVFSLSYGISLLTSLIDSVKPHALLTHTYEGGHPDHDSAALCTALACHILAKCGKQVPLQLEFPSYHYCNGALTTNTFLSDSSKIWTVSLSKSAKSTKRKMIDCFKTQAEMLKNFSLEKEYFRHVPRYDFTQPPHQGVLFYEHMQWGIHGSVWRNHAYETLAGIIGIV